jgi:putative ABC transport system permease protein
MIKLSTRMFKTNPSRTWLTILGMSVGTAAVVILVGLGFGLQNILLEKIVFGETLLSLNVTNPGSKAITLNKDQIKKLSQIENVKDVAPQASVQSLITYETLTSNIALHGANPNYFRYAGLSATKGKLFEDNQAANRNKVIISSAVLKLFNVDPPEKILGKIVRFRVFVPLENGDVQETSIDNDYVIWGIIDNPSVIEAYIPLDDLEGRLTVPFYERAQVRVTDSAFLTTVQDEVTKRGFVVSALSKTVDQANKIFAGIQAVLAVFGGIALIVSAIGMFNTMTVTLLERTAEIGIMRTIGASPRDVGILFLTESMVVGFLGGVMGIVIGTTVGGILNLTLNAVAARFGGASMSMFSFPIAFLLFIAAFSLVVGFLTGVFPARRAASLNPLDAIRYK